MNGRKNTFIQTVESVKKQTYKNIEHIIIDGASTDGTVDLIKSLNLTYYSEKDTGIYDALNKGIKKATGKYICFLHSDDYFNNENAVKLSAEALEKNNADFSFVTATVIDEDEKLLFTFKPMIWNVFSKMPFCHQTMFTKTEVLRKEGGFNLKYKSASDYDFIIRLMIKKYKYAEVKDNIVTFRTGGFSSVNTKLSILEQAEIFKTLYAPYINISDELIGKIIIKDTIPIKLLLNTKIKDWRTYQHYFFNLKKIKKFLIQLKIPGTKKVI